MPGLVPGIHVFLRFEQDVDGRDKPAMTGNLARLLAYLANLLNAASATFSAVMPKWR
jgi:hypothetical protein